MVAGPAAEISATAQADHFIPVRKSELLRALLADPSLGGQNRDKLRELERLMGAILHFEYFSRLDALRESYHPVDPELMSGGPVDALVFAQKYSAFVDKFTALLNGANFVEVSPDEVDRAHSEHAALRVSVHTPLDDFHAVRFF
ncbi:MAG TPA: DUF3754 domain-containing protein, partial [Xanthobacteraceae bacterium]|nr:DUF3754 domain-containing protein [Xanthobacteraceae bacterium]